MSPLSKGSTTELFGHVFTPDGEPIGCFHVCGLLPGD
jgi:hypothetical protein